jgi:hypothetical protein
MMSDANRRWFYGPLQPMETPRMPRSERLLRAVIALAIAFGLFIFVAGDKL